MNDVLTPLQGREFRLSELESSAADLLSHADSGIGDDRVAAVPDGRTLRYYQSLGIMDRPLRYDGRAAVYGYKSLIQAVCVKLLQSRGYSLAQCQRALAGASVERLEDAILDALGAGPVADAPPQRIAPVDETPSVRLVSVEVAPGVVVTVDPRTVENPDDVIRRVIAALKPGGSP